MPEVHTELSPLMAEPVKVDMEVEHLQVETSTLLSSETYHSKLLNNQSKSTSRTAEQSLRSELPRTEILER
jgi:hypothetical protein